MTRKQSLMHFSIVFFSKYVSLLFETMLPKVNDDGLVSIGLLYPLRYGI